MITDYFDVKHCGLLSTLQVEEDTTSLHSAASQKTVILNVTVRIT